EGNMKVVMMLS
ncbi:hypothetical protein AALP_AAs61339U000100, partial [Arabis alpina]